MRFWVLSSDVVKSEDVRTTWQCMPYTTMATKSEVWDHFFRSDQQSGNNKTHKAAWCNYCTNTTARQVLQEDTERVRNGEIKEVQNREALLVEGEFQVQIYASFYLYSCIARKRIKYITGKTSTLWNHLKNDCASCPEHVRQLARVARGEAVSNKLKLDDNGPGPSTIQQPGNIAKKAKLTQASFQVLKAPAIPFTKERQRQFELDLIRVFAAANFPLSAVEEPEFRHFFKTYLPEATLPWAKRFGGAVLSEEVAQLENELRSTAAGKLATVQCDGWKDISKKHLIAFMYTAQRIVSSSNNRSMHLLI